MKISSEALFFRAVCVCVLKIFLKIHVNVWHKPLQYCKVISLQLNKFLKISSASVRSVPFLSFIVPIV